MWLRLLKVWCIWQQSLTLLIKSLIMRYARICGSVMCYFSFSRATVNLCNSREESKTEASKKTFVSHLGVINVVKGNESQKQNSPILSTYCRNAWLDVKMRKKVKSSNNSLLLCGDISSLCQPINTETWWDFNIWNVEIYISYKHIFILYHIHQTLCNLS